MEDDIMDDGAKITELMLRASIESKLFMLKMIRNALALLIRHLEYLKANNLKPAWKSFNDKTQIKGVEAITRATAGIKQNVEQVIKDEQRKLDSFTLDKKYELE